MAEDRWRVEGWVPPYTDPGGDPTWSMTVVGQEAALAYLADAVRDREGTTAFRLSQVDPDHRPALTAAQRYGVAWWGRTATHGSCACCQKAGPVYPGYNDGQSMSVRFCGPCTEPGHEGGR